MELEINNVSKQFKEEIAVQTLQLTLHEGVYGLLGANGAGKTTLMRMICTLLEPTSGQILYDGEDIFQLKEHYRDIVGYLPQKFGYYPDFSAYDFLMYIAILKGFSQKDAKKRVFEVLELVNLSDVRKKKIQIFSGGMIQRLGIAQAILNDPKLLILDEPTAGLDPKERIRFRNIISNLSRNRIVILSTHIVSDVAYIANEILIMKKGKLILQGSAQDIQNNIKDCVYEIAITPTQLERYQQMYCISNIYNEGERIVLRVIDKQHTLLEGTLVEPTLEDVYLSEFYEEMRDQ